MQEKKKIPKFLLVIVSVLFVVFISLLVILITSPSNEAVVDEQEVIEKTTNTNDVVELDEETIIGQYIQEQYPQGYQYIQTIIATDDSVLIYLNTNEKITVTHDNGHTQTYGDTLATIFTWASFKATELNPALDAKNIKIYNSDAELVYYMGKDFD